MEDTKYFCDLTALTTDERGRYREFEKLLPSKIKSISEIADGYALSFPMSPENFTLVAEFVTYESVYEDSATEDAISEKYNLEMYRELKVEGNEYLLIVGGEVIGSNVACQFMTAPVERNMSPEDLGIFIQIAIASNILDFASY